VTEDVDVDGCLVVAMYVTGCAFAEGPMKFFMQDLVLLVLLALFAVFVVIRTVFSEAVDPM
jgi:hypothetical protein